MDEIKVKSCVGCGFCCIKAKCQAALRIYGSGVETCPALIWDNDRYHCHLMRLDGDLGLFYRKELYAGEGCCCDLNTWRNDVKNRTESEYKPFQLDSIFQMFLKSMGREMISGDTVWLIINGLKCDLDKRDYEKNLINQIEKAIYYNLKNQRNTMCDSFMGELNENKE